MTDAEVRKQAQEALERAKARREELAMLLAGILDGKVRA